MGTASADGGFRDRRVGAFALSHGSDTLSGPKSGVIRRKAYVSPPGPPTIPLEGLTRRSADHQVSWRNNCSLRRTAFCSGPGEHAAYSIAPPRHPMLVARAS